jgi:hypothetical protein
VADDLPRARDVLGMPVPPSWASAASVRLRNGLARTQDRMAPPFNVLLEKLFGMIEAKAIHVAVILGIPDALHEGPLTPAELADRVDQPVEDADALEPLRQHRALRRAPP